MTVAVLLSAGRIIVSLFLVRSVRACRSSGVALYLGGFAEFNMLATVALARSALWGSSHFCRLLPKRPVLKEQLVVNILVSVIF